MTDFTVWETAPFNSTIDHILQRYHNVHRAQFEELVPLAQKVAQVHADTSLPKFLICWPICKRAVDAHDERGAHVVPND